MARDFDGVDDKISIADATSLAPTTAITMAAWIQTDAVANATYYDVFNRRTAGNVGGYLCTLFGNGSNCLFRAFLYIGSWVYADTAASISTTGWYHVGATYNKVNIIPYLNGAAGTPNAQSANINNPASPNVRLGISAADDASNKFNGRIAELGMWKDVALSAAEMLALAKGVSPLRVRPQGLGLYMPLWGVATPEPDLSGNLNNGTVAGATLYNHAPVGRYVPFKHRWQPAGISIEYVNVTDSGVGTDAVLSIQEWLSITDTGLGTEQVYLLGEVLIDGLGLDHALRIRVSEPTNIASKPVSSGLPTRIYLGKQGRPIEIEGWVPTIAELNTIAALADGAVHYVQLPTGTRIPVHIVDARLVRPIVPGKYPYTISAVEVPE